MRTFAVVELLVLAAGAAAAGVAPDPGRVPSRIILSWSGDPARTQAVTWRTESSSATPQAQIAPLTGSPQVEASATTVRAVAATVALPDGRKLGHYSVEFKDLKPATKYTYRVGDGATWSEWNIFRTAADGPEPFRFLYLGDAHDEPGLWARVVRAAWSAAPDARFIVHAGDLVPQGYDDRQWGEWCGALGFIGAMLPSLAVAGNHDLQRGPGGSGGRPLAAPELWYRHFALPANGPEDLRQLTYLVDYQGVRFIAVSANVLPGKGGEDSAKEIAGKRQVAWLEKVLRDNPNRWTIVIQHQPVYPVSKGRQAAGLQKTLVPLYDKYGVDLVLQGHDHAYGRSFKLSSGRPVPATEPGTVYVVSVSGSQMYRLTPGDQPLMAKTLAGTQTFQVIRIEGDRLFFKTFSLSGSGIDSFELEKAPSKPHGLK